MHRISNISNIDGLEENDIVLQPEGDCIFITSAKSDLLLLANILKNKKNKYLNSQIRGVYISDIFKPFQLDHYLSTTASNAKLIILRILGGNSQWLYGVEQIINWKNEKDYRKIIMVSGSIEEDRYLTENSSFEDLIVNKFSELFKESGLLNTEIIVDSIYRIINNREVIIGDLNINKLDNPYLHDWQNDSGEKILIISYKSLYQSGEVDINYKLNKCIRKNNMCPRTIFISSLKESNIQETIVNIVRSEDIKIIITSTSFSSTNHNDQDISFIKRIKIPILQIVSSSNSYEVWNNSPIGLNPIDLLMQIAIPELDGRINTKLCTFKENIYLDKNLYTNIESYKSDESMIRWIVELTSNYIRLLNTSNIDKKICLIISNYPVNNGRLANGVGLDTPSSLIRILNILKQNGYNLGDKKLPRNSQDLMKLIISKRTNDLETISNDPLDYLDTKDYYKYFNKIPNESRKKVTEHWGEPMFSNDKEEKGYSIHGVKFGNITILIQPSRCYNSESLDDIHNPLIPPPHRYLAQYHWIDKILFPHAICHVGKHGSAEWLPGKSIGLGANCFPHLIIPPIPYFYPFIVNDPGEGSQAKRRNHAVIIDHLTPPLDKSDLFGDLESLDSLIEEFNECKTLKSNRIGIIEDSILSTIDRININTKELQIDSLASKDEIILSLESYLCELKQNQIRTGLHIFGKGLDPKEELNLIFLISKVPKLNRKGITQYVSDLLDLEFDPWNYEPTISLSDEDLNKLSCISNFKIYTISKALDFIDNQCKLILSSFIYGDKDSYNSLVDIIKSIYNDSEFTQYLADIKSEIYGRVSICGESETKALIDSFNSAWISSGPSGAPTRGSIEMLPTGRNFYSVDLRSIPSESAWQMGSKSATLILDLFKLENGIDLTNMAMSVWATSTMRNGGEDICQLLALLGVKPIWDGPTRKVIGLEIIPLSLLNRPRVDITLRISGMFRDSFPHLIELVNKAYNMISNLNEDIDSNPYLKSLKEGNCGSRIFGSSPGAYGAGLQELISSGNWESKSDLTSAFISWSKWSYESANDPKPSEESLKASLSKVQLVVHNQDNREHDILDSDDYYQFHGGLVCSIEELSENKPSIYHGDMSKFNNPKINTLKNEINKVVRTRLLNPKWINGMKNHGYKGAFEFGATMDYIYAYDATTGQVSNWCYKKIYDDWICDKDTLKFLMEHNPWVVRDISERLIEVINREMWSTKKKDIKDNLYELIAESELNIERGKYFNN
tara:strand:+ start:317 stop:4051 length:3735 start_codon:yes stop_codon:yes gene_type:complete